MTRALAYLEWCYVRHNVAAICRSPGRLLLWTLYVAVLALFGTLRFTRASSHHAHESLQVTPGAALGVSGAFLVLTAVGIAFGASGRFAAFRSPAEAILMSNAGVRPRTIAIWLQLRKTVEGSTRSFGSFAYAFLVFTPVHAGPFAALRGFFATVLILAVPQCAALPAFLLGRGRGRIPLLLFATVLGALGCLYAAAGFAGPQAWVPLVTATHLNIGTLASAALLARPQAFVLPLLLFAACVVVVAIMGDDALPEIYAASNRMLTRRQRGATGERATSGAKVARSAAVPAGALAIVWKEWVTLRRSSNGVRIWLGSAVAWAVCGAGAALAMLRFDDREAIVAFELTVALVILIWAPLTAASGLAAELSKPLFWLSHDSLRVRLTAWTFARAWRGGVALGVGVMAAAIVLDEPALAVLAVPYATIAYYALNALGIGIYAVFPSPLDSRGPTTILRTIASFAYLAAPGLAWLVAALGHAGALAGSLAFVLVLGLQSWLVIELVALRFTHYGASLATISRAR